MDHRLLFWIGLVSLLLTAGLIVTQEPPATGGAFHDYAGPVHPDDAPVTINASLEDDCVNVGQKIDVTVAVKNPQNRTVNETYPVDIYTYNPRDELVLDLNDIEAGPLPPRSITEHRGGIDAPNETGTVEVWVNPLSDWRVGTVNVTRANVDDCSSA